MALSGSALATQLIGAMRNITDSKSAITTFGSTVIGYLTANMQITYTWAGTNPVTGAPDPMVTAMATASGSGSFVSPTDINDLCQQIATAIKGLTITITDPTLVVAPLAFNPAGTIVIVMNQENTFEAAMQTLANQIVASIPSFVSTTPAAGTHAAFTGTATMVSIL